jgi:head-tail adaptor
MVTSNVKYSGLRAGQLRDLVEIQSRVDSLDAANAPLPPTWIKIGREWANVNQIQGFRAVEIEGVVAQQLFTSAAYEIRMRYRSDVTTKHRLVILGPPLDVAVNILSIADPDGRRRQLLLICQAGLVSG